MARREIYLGASGLPLKNVAVHSGATFDSPLLRDRSDWEETEHTHSKLYLWAQHYPIRSLSAAWPAVRYTLAQLAFHSKMSQFIRGDTFDSPLLRDRKEYDILYVFIIYMYPILYYIKIHYILHGVNDAYY